MTNRAKQEFTAELAQLVGFDVGSAELEETHTKLATALGVDRWSPKVLEMARGLAARRMHMERLDDAMNRAIDEGRMMPSQREHFFNCPDPEAAIAVVKQLQSVAVVRNPPAPEGVDRERLDLDRRVQAVALERGVAYHLALDHVLAEF
jgi:hypothetical protein